MVAWRPLPSDIVAADRGQRKVDGGKKQKKVTINRRCRLRECWHGGTAMWHCRARLGAVQSGHGGSKKKVTINWRYCSVSGGVVAQPCDIVVAGSTQRKVDMVAKKQKKGNNQPEVQAA